MGDLAHACTEATWPDVALGLGVLVVFFAGIALVAWVALRG